MLIQAVKRNLECFPEDFMLQLSAEEWTALRSQSVISNVGRGGRRYAPYAFGVAMAAEDGKAKAVSIIERIVRDSR